MKAYGLTEKSNPKPILGYTDTETVKLDFDDMPFMDVKYWAQRVMRWFKLGGFIVSARALSVDIDEHNKNVI